MRFTRRVLRIAVTFWSLFLFFAHPCRECDVIRHSFVGQLSNLILNNINFVFKFLLFHQLVPFYSLRVILLEVFVKILRDSKHLLRHLNNGVQFYSLFPLCWFRESTRNCLPSPSHMFYIRRYRVPYSFEMDVPCYSHFVEMLKCWSAFIAH